jgi:MFS family permease
MSNYRQLLRNNPDYTRLWLAQAVSLLGDWFDTIVLFALVSKFSNNSGIAVAGLLLARFLPPLLVSPFAGVLVDRLNRKRLLIISDLLRSATVLMFLLATGPEHLGLIYVLTIIQFMLSAVFEPGRSALLPSVVQKSDLVLANTLGSVTWSVMLAAGAAVGGLVAGLFGTGFALVVDSLSFLLSALLIAQIKVRADAVTAPVSQSTSTAPKRTFREGLRYLRANPSTASTLLVKMGGSVGSIDLAMTVYATEYFVLGNNGTLSLGILWSAFGLGAIIGPLILNRFNDGTLSRMRRLIIVGYVWITLGWIIFGAAPTLIIACIGLAVKAMGSSIYWTYSSVLIQRTVPDAYLGRVFSLDIAGFQLTTVLSILLVGGLADTFGSENIRAIVFGTAVVSVIPLAIWAFLVPRLDRRKEAEAEAVEELQTPASV